LIINTEKYKEIHGFRKLLASPNKIKLEKGASTLLFEVSVEIISFYLRVPIIEYNSEAKIDLISELCKSSYIFHLKKWQCVPQSNIIVNTLNNDITNTYRNVYNPVWVFVAFQVYRSNSQLKLNGIFDHVNFRNLCMEINGMHYT
jgi:hypothetical protein